MWLTIWIKETAAMQKVCKQSLQFSCTKFFQLTTIQENIIEAPSRPSTRIVVQPFHYAKRQN
jgi:hypothetical protein